MMRPPGPMLRNPYTNRAAVVCEEDFFGRTNDLAGLYSRLLGDQSVSLVGERRVGKSSLLRALDFDGIREDFDVPNELRFVYLDLQFVAECNEEEIVRFLLDELTGVLNLPRHEADREALMAVGRQALRSGYRLVMVMDEFDILLHNQAIPLSFFSFLRAWSSRFRACFAVASREGSIEPILETSQSGSPFLNIFGAVYVGPLEAPEAEDLVFVPAERLGMPFSPEEGEWIFDLGGHHPLFLNIACTHLFDLKLHGVAEEQISRRLDAAFLTEAAPHFEYLFNRIPEKERAVLRHLIEGRKDIESEGLFQLNRKGIVIRHRDELRPFSKSFSRLVMAKTDKKVSKSDLLKDFKRLM